MLFCYCVYTHILWETFIALPSPYTLTNTHSSEGVWLDQEVARILEQKQAIHAIERVSVPYKQLYKRLSSGRECAVHWFSDVILSGPNSSSVAVHYERACLVCCILLSIIAHAFFVKKGLKNNIWYACMNTI